MKKWQKVLALPQRNKKAPKNTKKLDLVAGTRTGESTVRGWRTMKTMTRCTVLGAENMLQHKFLFTLYKSGFKSGPCFEYRNSKLYMDVSIKMIIICFMIRTG